MHTWVSHVYLAAGIPKCCSSRPFAICSVSHLSWATAIQSWPPLIAYLRSNCLHLMMQGDAGALRRTPRLRHLQPAQPMRHGNWHRSGRSSGPSSTPACMTSASGPLCRHASRIESRSSSQCILPSRQACCHAICRHGVRLGAHASTLFSFSSREQKPIAWIPSYLACHSGYGQRLASRCLRD